MLTIQVIVWIALIAVAMIILAAAILASSQEGTPVRVVVRQNGGRRYGSDDRKGYW